MFNLEQFQHKGYSLWAGEVCGRDVTIVRKHGDSRYVLWIDNVMIGRNRGYALAEKRLARWLKKSTKTVKRKRLKPEVVGV
jgi:hypothetical protein